jgi:S-adenosylmethionine decarboxylase
MCVVFVVRLVGLNLFSLKRRKGNVSMYHVLLDLYEIDAALLANEDLLRRTLEELPTVIGMQQANPVFLKDSKTSSPQDDGLSGFVIISTSHISLHAWPPYGMLNLDVFSCEPFTAADVVAFVTKRFQTTNYDMQHIERATRSPRKKTARASTHLREVPAESGPRFDQDLFLQTDSLLQAHPPRPHLRGRA